MLPNKLEEAIKEAERFLVAARKVKINIIHGIGPSEGRSWPTVKWPSKENATCLRASLDLTRALAELRK